MKRNYDLFIANGIVLTNLLFVAVPILNQWLQWLQVLSGLIIALALSGYIVLAAILPSIGRTWYEHLLLSIGLSIVFDIAGGLLLNETSWGLQSATWSLFFAVIIIVFSIIAAVQRHRSNLSTIDLVSFHPFP